MTLYPYYHGHCWVFDDPATGLKAEAFVRGMSEMIDRMVAHKRLPNARRGFALTFAAQPVMGHDVELLRLRQDGGGNWYVGDVAGERMEGWLCPALFKYFPAAAPSRIFVRCDPLPAGVNPIWDNRPGQGMHFMGPEDARG